MRALLLGIAQLDDPACFGVLARSIGLALLAYIVLLLLSIWGVREALALVHWPGWLGAIIATLGVALLAIWLFLPTVLVIATFYIDRIAQAVDRRYYAWLPPPDPAILPVQLYDGLALALQVLLLNGLALLLALLPIPGVGLVLAVLVSGWAIGRGLFVTVAMRRMGRTQARELYNRNRFAVLLPGLLLALASTLPGVNLLVPVVGTATMVHVLNRRLE